MLNRFQHGVILEFQAGEDLKNNDMYIIDPKTNKIRKPKDCDEWLTCRMVYVFNVPTMSHHSENYDIKKDEWCRCWTAYLVI